MRKGLQEEVPEFTGQWCVRREDRARSGWAPRVRESYAYLQAVGEGLGEEEETGGEGLSLMEAGAWSINMPSAQDGGGW